MHRAIETRYAGYRFRSRLEARYAVLFDNLKIKWDYEPEGFELPDGRYLPDFFLSYPEDSPQAQLHSGAGYWVEIKPLAPTLDERRKLAQLCHASKHHGYFFIGAPNAASITISQHAGRAPDFTQGASLPLVHAAPLVMVPRAPGDISMACLTATEARFEFRDALRRRA